MVTAIVTERPLYLQVFGARGENILDVARRLGLGGATPDMDDEDAAAALAVYMAQTSFDANLMEAVAAAAAAESSAAGLFAWNKPFNKGFLTTTALAALVLAGTLVIGDRGIVTDSAHANQGWEVFPDGIHYSATATKDQFADTSNDGGQWKFTGAVWADATLSLLKPASAYITTARRIANRFLDGGISLNEGGGAGGVAPGNSNAAADTAAMKNLISDMAAAGGTLLIPDGAFYIDDKISVGGKSAIILKGTGRERSTIIREATAMGGAAGLFDITMPAATATVQTPFGICDLSLIADAAPGDCGTALSCGWVSGAGNITPAFRLRDVGIMPSDRTPGAGKSFGYGLVLNNAVNNKITGLHLSGAQLETPYPTLMGAGVYLEGTTVDTHMLANHLYNTGIAIYITDQCEGFYSSHNTLVYHREGLVWLPTSYSGVLCHVENTHMSTIETGCRFQSCHDIHIQDSDFQKREGTDENYTGVYIGLDCSKFDVHDMNFTNGAHSTQTTTCDYIHVVDGSGSTKTEHGRIHDNLFELGNKGVFLEGGAQYIDVYNNKAANGMDDLVYSSAAAGSHNYFWKNEDDLVTNDYPYTTIPNGTTQPYVDNSKYSWFLTANSGATTITNLLGGKRGLEIELKVNEGNTTVQHNSAINLQGGVNASGNGLVLRLKYDGAMWLEIGRRTP